MRFSDKDLTDLCKEIREHGVGEVKGGTRHVKVLVRGRLVVTLPLTGSDWRGLKNSRAELVRAGVLPPSSKSTGSKRGSSYYTVGETPITDALYGARKKFVRTYRGPRLPAGRQPKT